MVSLSLGLTVCKGNTKSAAVRFDRQEYIGISGGICSGIRGIMAE